MKVIIELNENVKLEINESDESLVNIFIAGIGGCVKIEDLKLALRKLTAK
jgi:hypothetical protein